MILTGNALGKRGAAKFVVVSNALILFPSADQVSQQRNLKERNESQDLAVKGLGLSEGSAEKSLFLRAADCNTSVS